MKQLGNRIYGWRNARQAFLWSLMAISLTLASCSRTTLTSSEETNVEEPESTQEEELVPMRITLLADGNLTVKASTKANDSIFSAAADPMSKAINNTILSKASSGPDETLVQDAWILQFEMESEAADADGTLVYRKYVSGSDIYQSNTMVEISAMLAQSEHGVIVVVANPPEALNTSNLPDGTKLSEFRKRTFDISASAGTSLPDDASTALPMTGESVNMPISLIGAQSIALKLTRLVARMNLILINPYYKSDAYPYLELQEVSVHNAPLKISYSPLNESNTYQETLFPAADAANFKDYTATNTGFGETNSLKWYIAPNRRGTGTATSSDDKSAFTAPEGQANYCTYIQIKGLLKETASGAQTEVYYNVYLGNNNTNDYNLWANNAYRAQLTIKGFNSGSMEVGYDGFAVEVGGVDGQADNTIIGWHPDTGLDPVPGFTAFSPDQIDFGNAPTAADGTVTFTVNSQWRFNYEGADKDYVVASATHETGNAQVGGSDRQPTECTVTFTPKAYTAQDGIPAAGNVYNVVARFESIDEKDNGEFTVYDTRTTILYRTIPAFYGEPTVNPAGNTEISRKAQAISVSLPSNAKWSATANPGTTTTQQPDTYQTRSRNVTVSANYSWSSRSITVTVQYGDKTKTYTYTQKGQYISGVTISPDPSSGIPAEGGNYDITITGDFSSVPVRAVTGSTVIQQKDATEGETVTLTIPYNPDTDNTRHIIFQYQKNGQWIEIKGGTQAVNTNVDFGAHFLLDPDYPHTGTWTDAKNYCANKKQQEGGWRLPTLNEYRFLYAMSFAFTGKNAFIKHAHWTSTLYSGNAGEESAEYYFLNYQTGNTHKAPVLDQYWNSAFYIRCIKSIAVIDRWPMYVIDGESIEIVLRSNNGGFPEEAMFSGKVDQTTLNGDIENETYNKLSRRFQIQPSDATNTMTYPQAVEYCNNLKLDDKSNWRLPTAREMHMLFVIGANNKVLQFDYDNTTVTGATNSNRHPLVTNYLYNKTTWFSPFKTQQYWTANTSNNGTDGWTIDFENGFAQVVHPTDSYYVRCIRDSWDTK